MICGVVSRIFFFFLLFLDNFLLNSKNDLEESDYYRARELIGKFHEEEREESAWLLDAFVTILY